MAEKELWAESDEDAEIRRRVSITPCFMNCGEPACHKLGCVRIYNERERIRQDIRTRTTDEENT